MSHLSDYLAANVKYWDELADLHFNTPFYDVEGVRHGKDTLTFDTDIIGEVTGRSLLHLHCHFGLDTISWARRGAIATGIDFSPRAIGLAKQLANEAGVSVNFLCTEVSRLSEFLPVKFDIVWAVEGILSWIPDLRTWMDEAAYSLRPGGILYIRDFHPAAEVLANDEIAPRICRTYFNSVRCVKVSDEAGTYADRNLKLKQKVHYEWQHPLSEVLTSLLRAGFVILRFEEYPFCTYQSHKFLVKNTEGHWVFPASGGDIPLMFSVFARRSALTLNNTEESHA